MPWARISPGESDASPAGSSIRVAFIAISLPRRRIRHHRAPSPRVTDHCIAHALVCLILFAPIPHCLSSLRPFKFRPPCELHLRGLSLTNACHWFFEPRGSRLAESKNNSVPTRDRSGGRGLTEWWRAASQVEILGLRGQVIRTRASSIAWFCGMHWTIKLSVAFNYDEMCGLRLVIGAKFWPPPVQRRSSFGRPAIRHSPTTCCWDPYFGVIGT